MKNENVNGCLAAIVAVVVVMPASLFLYAWAAELNWNWFAVPLGAPRITMWQAYGLALVLTSFSSHQSKSEDSDDLGPILIKAVLYITFRFAFLVAAGWFVHTYLVGGST